MTGLFRITFADGAAWELRAEGQYPSRVLRRLGRIVQSSPPPPRGYRKRRLLLRDRGAAGAGGPADGSLSLLLEPCDKASLAFDVMKVLLTVARFSIAGGGVLLHSGLSVRDGAGVLLGGRSKAGKSTTARLLRPPWRSLCDDVTLVVPDDEGIFHAHPLPTWSRIPGTGAPERWETSRAVPLQAAFLLEQSLEDRAVPVGRGEGLCLLNEISDQAAWPLTDSMPEAERRAFRLTLLDNLARLTGAVPVFRLRFTRRSAFVGEMERVTAACRSLAETTP